MLLITELPSFRIEIRHRGLHIGDSMLLNVSEIAFLLQEGSEFPYRKVKNSIFLHDFLLSS
jgi:hypothetical protein